jgi:hypothetical protein
LSDTYRCYHAQCEAHILALNAGFGLAFANGYNYRSYTLTVRIAMVTSKAFLACLFMLPLHKTGL